MHGKADRIQLLELPQVGKKGDVSEFIERGGTREQLDALASSAPEWRPALTLNYQTIQMGDEDKLPPLEWLVKGVISIGELSVVYAPAGGGKSFFVLDLAARIAAGFDWFDRRTKQGPVMYVCGEGATGFRNRMKAWRERHQPESNPPFYLVPRSLDFRSNADAAMAIASDAETLGRQIGQPVKMIVLDTLSRMLGGGVDAEPRDIAAFLHHVELLREKSGAHVCIVHHIGKDKERGPRGASQIRDVADTCIEIMRPGDGDVFRAEIVKQKDGEDGTVFTYTLAKSVVGKDEDGEDITSCTVQAADATPGADRPRYRPTDAEEHALRALHDLLAHGTKPPPELQLPASVTACVTLSDWREAVYQRPITSSDDPAAKRQAFHRIRSKLTRYSLICELKEHVWLP